MSLYIYDSSWKGVNAPFIYCPAPQGKITLASASSHYAQMPYSVGELNGDFELEVKYKRSATGSNYILMSKRDIGYSTTTNVRGWHILLYSFGGTAYFSLYGWGTNGGSLGFYDRAVADDTNWHTVIVKRSSTTISVSVDGGAFGTTTSANLNAGFDISDDFYSPTQIGRDWSGSGGYGAYMNGEIEYIKIWKGGDRTTGTLNHYLLFNNAGTNTKVYNGANRMTGQAFNGAVQVSLGTTTNTYYVPKSLYIYDSSWKQCWGTSTTNLAGEFLFESYISGTFYDTSGNARDGTNSGISYGNDTYGTYAICNGSSGYLRVSSQAMARDIFKTNLSWTISLWARTSATEGTLKYVFYNPLAGANQSGASIGHSGSDFSFTRWVNGTNYSLLATSINDGNWHHYVFMFDGTNISVYKDGAIVGSPASRWW